MDAGGGALIGRERELAEIASALDGGGGALLLVRGEPGIGKTRLAGEAARLARARGFTVAWGRAWEAGGAPPYWPWIEALRQLPGCGEAVRALEGAPSAQAGERFQLFDAVAEQLRAMAAERPLLLLLDDLHAADPASLQLLELVARRLRGGRAVLLGGHRDVEARMREEISASIARLDREARVLELARLSAAQTSDLVRAVSGRHDDELAQAVHGTSEGNPLFAHELLRLLQARGATTGAGVPEGVRAVIRQRLALLSPATVALLGAAAVVGREFALAVAAEVAGVTAEALAEALAEAEGAELLAAADAGRYRFSHALVAETLVADVPATQRARLHRRTAETLARLHGDDDAAPLDEIAHHWLQAGADAAATAVEAAVRAAARASRRLAFEDAAELLERALAALAAAAPGDAARRAELLLGLGEAALRAGESERGRRACLDAAELARARDLREVLARAALTLGAEFAAGLVDHRLVTLLEEALAALPPGDGALRAQLLARLAGALQPAPDPRVPMQLARDAIDMARRLGDAALLHRVLHAAMAGLMDYAHPAERAPLNQEVVRLATAAGDRPVMLRGRMRLAFDLLELAELDRYQQAVAEFDALAQEFRHPRYHWAALLFRSAEALLQGRDDEADALEAQARQVAERVRDTGLERSLLFRRPFVLARRGQLEALPSLVEPLVAAIPGAPGMPAVIRAWAAAQLGRADDARRELATLGREQLAWFGHDMNAAAMLAEAATTAAMPEVAEAIYDTLLPRQGLACVATGVGFFVQDLIDRTLLQLATLLRRWDEADAHAERALAVAGRLGAAPLAALVRRDLEASRRARGVTAPPPPAVATLAIELTREGDFWTLRGGGELCRLRDSRGVRVLARLVAEPGRELHVLDLVEGAGDDEASVIDAGDAGELLDAEARAAYQARLGELREELAEAERWNDPARRARLEREAEALTREVAAAVGLGGRERRAGRAAERARVNVQRRLADTLKRVQEAAPGLGRHLAATVRTGSFCCYQPDQPRARRG